MKKNDWILIATVALYSFLFYQQTAGINFTLFTIALITALLIKDNALLKNTSWKLAAVGSLVSSICIGYYGNGLSITANIISLSMLSALSYNGHTSVIASLLFSFYSYSSSLAFMFLDWQKRKAAKINANPSVKRWSLIIIPMIITLLFFFMYRSSNALFNNFTKSINFDFISFNWISFTLGGLILLYGFFYHQKIKAIAELEKNASNTIDPLTAKTITLFGKTLSVNDEEFSGKLLFLLLNLLLLVVNTLDVHFMVIDNKLPEGVTYSEFVHQGTGMLITSILIAIAIILFYFRGALNFSEKSRIIKILAFAWIIQNAFMICSTMFRNNMYVSEYGLTYKRIGVYVYLILTLIGLITTFIKIIQIRTNTYLFRVNGWLFYAVLVTAAFVNWDRLIADFNIHKAKQVQADYLLELSYTILPDLYSYHISSDEKNPAVKNKLEYPAVNFEKERDRQLYYFLLHADKTSWKSWYYDLERTQHKLAYLASYQKITALQLPSLNIQSMTVLQPFCNIQKLDVYNNKLASITELADFKSLQNLNIGHNKLQSLKGVETLKNLEYLDVRGNTVIDYSPLYSLKKLKQVRVDATISNVQYAALQQNLPGAVIIKI